LRRRTHRSRPISKVLAAYQRGDRAAALPVCTSRFVDGHGQDGVALPCLMRKWARDIWSRGAGNIFGHRHGVSVRHVITRPAAGVARFGRGASRPNRITIRGWASSAEERSLHTTRALGDTPVAGRGERGDPDICTRWPDEFGATTTGRCVPLWWFVIPSLVPDHLALVNGLNELGGERTLSMALHAYIGANDPSTCIG